MKEFVVLSGRGGVGRSSLTAAIGTILADKYSIVVAETDGGAPNPDIVRGTKLQEVITIEASEKAVIDYDQCSRCMLCLDVCRFSAIIGGEEPIIVSYSCEGCGACALACPADAVSIQSMVNGRLSIFDGGKFRVVAGELGMGEPGAGRLVDVVRKRARREAEKQMADLIITDGPPGIGGPAIASVKGADYVILVTEPTPPALHDLQRIIEVVSHFAIPVGIVLNRCDLHDAGRRRVRQYLEEKKVELLAEIPYDPLLPTALAEGRPAVEAYPDAPSSGAIRRLAKVLDGRLGRRRSLFVSKKRRG